MLDQVKKILVVSTHSRPKAAAIDGKRYVVLECVSTHSRPKAAAVETKETLSVYAVSTHSRPKAAAHIRCFFVVPLIGFNTQPPEGGCS